MSDYIMQNSGKREFSNDDSWVILSKIEQQIKDKVEKIGKPLKEWNISIYRGILTGYNEAFIISGEKREEILGNCKSDDERQKTAELIRPILRGRDVKRYEFTFQNLWVIATFPSKKYDINEYPAIKDYLLNIGIKRLEQTGKKYIINGEEIKTRKRTNNKWFETQDSINYWEDFSKQKIIYPDIMRMPKNNTEYSDYPHMFLDSDKYYVEATNFMMVGDSLKLILGVLTSKLGVYSYANYYAGSIFDTKGIRYKKVYLENFPIPKLDINEIDTLDNINNLVDKLHEAKKLKLDLDKIQKLDELLDNYIYQIYGLNNDEINEIDNYFKY